MEYLLILLILSGLEFFYFKIANRYNIIDKPNQRSSHAEITLRGGGIIFWFASLLYFVQYAQDNYFFFTGITLVSLVSFWDDIQSLSSKIRLLAQITAISIIFYNLEVFSVYSIWIIIASYIFFIGVINAYNFMDGINGITGIYTLAVLGSLMYVNYFVEKFTENDFIIYPLMASIVFLFFNFRKKAKCFAGDVGSIAIAFWIIYLLIAIIIKTNSPVWILFLAVYQVDTIATVAHRAFLKQNIFKAHRLHFYQILCNEYKISHRIVALGYGFLQIAVSFLVIHYYKKIATWIIFISILLPLIAIYLLKFYFLKKHQNKTQNIII